MIDKLKKYKTKDWAIAIIFIFLVIVLYKIALQAVIVGIMILIFMLGAIFSAHLACIIMITANSFWNVFVNKHQFTLFKDLEEKCIWNVITKYIKGN